MPQHEIKTCKRCGTLFECKLGDISNCQCSSVTLEAQTQSFLEETRYDCLCANCLQTLNSLVKIASASQLPKARHEFKEGIHYYLESGALVFTEFYHIQRGYCCGNGCRHCAYG